MQFWPPDDEHMCPKHVEAWNKTYCETKILCIKLVNYWDKYTEMHGQQKRQKLEKFVATGQEFSTSVASASECPVTKIKFRSVN